MVPRSRVGSTAKAVLLWRATGHDANGLLAVPGQEEGQNILSTFAPWLEDPDYYRWHSWHDLPTNRGSRESLDEHNNQDHVADTRNETISLLVHAFSAPNPAGPFGSRETPPRGPETGCNRLRLVRRRRKMSMERLWKVKETAGYLGVSTSWVYHHAANGTLPAIRFGGHLRFEPGQVRRFAGLGDPEDSSSGPALRSLDGGRALKGSKGGG